MNLPPDTRNSRFFTDPFARHRPALSIVGFDNQENNIHGYGLKQIIERALDPTSRENAIISTLIEKATRHPKDKDAPVSDAKTQVVNHNSQLLQGRAFIALLTLVLEQNGQTLPDVQQPSHAYAMEMLRASLLTEKRLHPLYANEMLSGPDRVKWTTSLCNMARGIDLYLALENAYAHYGLPEDLLLTETEKEALLDRHILGISQVLEVVDSNIGIGALISGNWSLKMWAAEAYACLGTQYKNEAEARQLFVWFGRGLRRASPGDKNDKRRYWTYMSTREVGGALSDSQRTWAEGPYYLHFTLQDVLPLWHAVRANGYLTSSDHEVDIDDPFYAPWFTEPISWLADITTHAGETPPFDDGNRRPMFNAHLMAWNEDYGIPLLGEKMNWIFQRVSSAKDGVPTDWKTINNDVLLQYLAMPKAVATAPPAAIIGNRNIIERHEEQLILRRTINGKTHFVCIHGEPDIESIARGEGHEQPDQLQLLYYVDEQSLIMDAGYDRGFITKNSSWNRYTDHNVMAYAKGDSGMKSPDRLTKQVQHTPVDFLYFDPASTESVSIMKGQTRLHWLGGILSPGNLKDKTTGQYARTVLFIADETYPYLIDINQVKNTVEKGTMPGLNMRYHVGSNDYSQTAAGWHSWHVPNAPGCHLYFDCVEHDDTGERILIEEAEVEERFRTRSQIKRFTCEGKPRETFTTVGLFRAGADAPFAAPQAIAPADAAATYRIWQWDNQESDTIDILFVKSLALLPQSAMVQFEVSLEGEQMAFISGENKDIGYARCKKIDGTWHVLPDFLFGLEMLAPTIEA
ncbi:MAG: hypothetical protein AAF564_09440 [Bacteroidota bacterium]